MSHFGLLPNPDELHMLRIETLTAEDSARVILQGEADIATLRDLDTALEHVELGGAATVQLELDGLEFADSATIRRLAAFAREAKRTGHDVQTCGASPTLRKVARMLNVQDDLGLV